jgi:hypothetical protein
MEPVNFTSIDSAKAAWVFGGFSFTCLACGSVHEVSSGNELCANYIYKTLQSKENSPYTCDEVLSKYFKVRYVASHPSLKVYLPKQNLFDSPEPDIQDMRSYKLITWMSDIINSQVPQAKSFVKAFESPIYWLALEPDLLPDLYNSCLEKIKKH